MLDFRKIEMIFLFLYMQINSLFTISVTRFRILFVFCNHSIGRLTFSFFLFEKRGYERLRHQLCLPFHLCQMFAQHFGCQQIVIPNPLVLLHILLISFSAKSNFNFFFGRYFQIGKHTIAFPGIFAACFFINVFHRKNSCAF